MNSPKPYYLPFVPASFAERVREMLGERSPAEMLSLYEEIAVMRTVATDATILYAASDELKDKVTQMEMKVQAFAFLDQVFRRIESLAKSAAQIDNLNRTSSAIVATRAILEYSIRLVRELNGSDLAHLSDQFERRIRAAIRIADDDVHVGPNNPGSDVSAMDDTVPEEEF